MVLREGIVLATIGILLGLLGATALTRLMANTLFAVEPLDTATFAAVGVTVLGTALVACYLPARRATTVDSLRVG
jgi:putative ABC transport system permease protein